MARKKPQTYNDVVRSIAEMSALLVNLKRHMVEVLAGAMDDKTAAMLGDFSDADLRRVAGLMFAHAGEYAAQVKAEKLARDKGRQEARQPQIQQGILPQQPAQY